MTLWHKRRDSPWIVWHPRLESSRSNDNEVRWRVAPPVEGFRRNLLPTSAAKSGGTFEEPERDWKMYGNGCWSDVSCWECSKDAWWDWLSMVATFRSAAAAESNQCVTISPLPCYKTQMLLPQRRIQRQLGQALFDFWVDPNTGFRANLSHKLWSIELSKEYFEQIIKDEAQPQSSVKYSAKNVRKW